MNPHSSYSYHIVDVFTEHPLEGNALAVLPDASGLDDDTMQKIAREMNLSETVFIIPPTRSDCCARLRIFTPAREMAFAGHPTIGASFVLRREGLVDPRAERFVVEELVGPVPILVDSGDRPMIWLRTPPIREGHTFEPESCARALGLQSSDLLPFAPQLLSAGNPTVFIALKNPAAVDKALIHPESYAAMRQGVADPICVFVFAPTPAGAYSRMFAPEHGIIEDPATGSSTGPLAAYMLRHGLVSGAAGSQFVSEQGTRMKRRSILHVRLQGAHGCDGIDVGGHVTPVASGELSLPRQ
jgi:trans-2,3-dihydro-3-hydroxyanthranilate isomerase